LFYEQLGLSREKPVALILVFDTSASMGYKHSDMTRLDLAKKMGVTVALNVRFGTLADATSYTAQTTLDVKAKNIRVVVENSGRGASYAAPVACQTFAKSHRCSAA
jgi:hypothetical protein